MNISTLEQYVDQLNRWNQMFDGRQFSLLNAKDRQLIMNRIDSELSPENLTCDGELSRTEVDQRYRYLTRVQQELRSIDPQLNSYEY